MPSAQEKPALKSTACLSCRAKHLKCEGRKPTCERCLVSGLHCTYLQSQRGQKGGRRKRVVKISPESLSDTTFSAFQSNYQNVDSPQSSINRTQVPLHVDHVVLSLPLTSATESDRSALINVYYRYIHPAHPFLIPRKLWAQSQGAIIPNYLKDAMCFIASHHTAIDSELYRQKAQIVFDAEISEDGFKVQALLLLTLTFYARCERDQGSKALEVATSIASRVRLDSETFGKGQLQILQETWRRTWWELYTVGALVSLTTKSNTRLNAPNDRLLPISSEDYEYCKQTQSGSLADMQERSYSNSRLQWSSYAYKVEATRILAEVLSVGENVWESPYPSGDAVGASITSFLLSLPIGHLNAINKNSEVDEVMSSALMIIHLAGIVYHLPRSFLSDIRSFKTICGNDRNKHLADDRLSHASSALRSANALSSLMIGRHSLNTITPCFSCALAYSVNVQLSSYFVETDPTRRQSLKENVQLALSALGRMSETWEIARVVREQLSQFARDLFGNPPQPATYAAAPADGLLEGSYRPTIEDSFWLYDFMAEADETLDTIPLSGLL